MRMHPVTVVVAVYLCMVVAWVWPPLRFLAPLAPLLLWLSWVACRDLLGRYGASVAGALLAASMAQLATAALHVREKGTAWPAPAHADDWRLVSPLLKWIADETPPHSVVTGNLDPQYYLYANRKAVRAFESDSYRLYYKPGAEAPLGTVDDLRRRLLRFSVDYLVLTPGLDFREMPHLRALVQHLEKESPGSISPVAGNPANGYAVYRVDGARLQSVPKQAEDIVR
jgi:hypothetical protein